MALSQDRWLACARFIANGKGLSINFNGTADQLRTRIRTAILAAGIENQSIDTAIQTIDPDGVPHTRGYRSAYNVRETYERMFGFDLLTDAPL